MPNKRVGPASDYPTIAAALASGQVHPGETIFLEPSYTGETATVSIENLFFNGDASNTSIVLNMGAGISTITLTGTAPINVNDNPGNNTITGNDGDNTSMSQRRHRHRDHGRRHGDRLIVDFSGAATDVQTYNQGFGSGPADRQRAGWLRRPLLRRQRRPQAVFTGVEHFTVTTGSGNDTIYTGNGDDVVDTGDGNDFINAFQGTLTADGGVGTDSLSADLSAFGAITLNLQNGLANSFPAGVSISNIEVLTNFTTGSGDDVIVTRDNGVGGPNNDSIITGDGNDTVTVVRGADTVAMGEGTGDRLIVDFSGAVTDVRPIIRVSAGPR